jgi:hypothetical protein
MKRGDSSFDTSSKAEDADAQVAIRKWFIFAILKNAFGSSSDTILTRLRELLIPCHATAPFPAEALYASLQIKPQLDDSELERIAGYQYQGRYTNLILSRLYPDRDWRDAVFHEDHIFPKSDFTVRDLKKRGYDEEKIAAYLSKYNSLANLQLLTESENLSKNATPFESWIKTRDQDFHKRHLIPDLPEYSFDSFEQFFDDRRNLITAKLKEV